MITVTGGTGLIGSHIVCDLLLAGKQVKVLVRPNSDKESIRTTISYYSDNYNELFSKIIWVEGDTLDYDSLLDAFEGSDTVIHTAAMVSFDASERYKMFSTNIDGTQNVVNACIENGVKQLGYISSVAALGTAPDGEPTTEETGWLPDKKNSNYSISKFHSEMEIWRGIEEGLNAVIVNPTVVIGPGHWDKGSSSLIKTVAKGLKFYTPGAVGYVDVRDVSRCLLTLLEQKKYNQRFLLNSENISYKNLFNLIADSLEVKRPSIEAKYWMVMLGAYVDKLASLLTGKPHQLSRATARSSFHRSFYSSGKIINTLNYRFITVKQSVQDAAAIYLKERK
jgi:nucleoside-diphosphate-sugar epimerase